MTTYRYADLLSRGLPRREIRSLVRTGELTRVRHGGYRSSIATTPEDEYLGLIKTTAPGLAPDSVLSHVSAATLWGMPVPWRLMTKVHAIRLGSSGGKIGQLVHSHRRELQDDQITVLDGLLVTTLARTAIDVASQIRRHESLGVLDAALRMGCSSEQLAAEVRLSAGNTGIAQARWALRHADARAESPAESISRYWMIVGGVPLPTLQFEVRAADGQLLGRSDFAWEELGVLGEFDGKFKYEPEAFDGGPVADVVFAEKRRQNNFTFEGWTTIRWDNRDLRNGPAFASRLNVYLRSRPQWPSSGLR